MWEPPYDVGDSRMVWGNCIVCVGEIICGAPKTLAVKGLMMMIMMIMSP